MSIEAIPDINLDEVSANLIAKQVSDFEEKNLSFATLTSSIEDWEKIRDSLCQFRASNISALLALRPSEELLDDEEILQIFSFLREWDQLTLQNILAICEAWIPMEYLPSLQAEAKVELKWFKEWLMAASDTRIHKYPGLPWRSFIRKVVNENFLFAVNYLKLAGAPATPENVTEVQNHFNSFLESKKKVLAVFPKRLNKH